MKIQKTWLTVHFTKGKATIELTINYKTKSISMTHGNNDGSVTFSASINEISNLMDRSKCVQAALKFAKEELK